MTTPPHDGDRPDDLPRSPPAGPTHGPPAGPPDGPTAAGRSRGRAMGVTAVAVGALVVVGAVVAGVLVARSHSDEARIRTLVSQFAAVVDDEDQDGILSLMCREEAADITADDDYDPSR